MKIMLLVAGTLLALLAPEVRGADDAVRIACATYTFHKFSAFEAAEKSAACGVRYLETFSNQRLSPTDETKMKDLSDAQIAALRAHLAKLDVAIASCVVTIPPDEAGARRMFEYVRKLGANAITTESIRSLDVIEKLAKEYDFRVAIHTHAKNAVKPEYRTWDPSFVLGLVKDRDPRIGACAETGHWATSGIVPLDAIKLLEGRVTGSHLKERSVVGERRPDMVYGTGVVEIGAIVAELKRQKFAGVIVIEYEANPTDNMDEVKQCVEFLRAHWPEAKFGPPAAASSQPVGS